MTTEKKVPALQTTMQPAAASGSNPEKGPADLNGEKNTTTVPPVEEEIAESPEGEESAADSAKTDPEAKPEDEGKKDGESEFSEYELYLEDEEGDGKKPTPEESAAFYRMRKAEAEAARLKRELEALKAPPGVADPGPEPTAEDCAFNEEELKKRIREWDKKKDAFEAHKAKQAEQEAAAARELNARTQSYDTAAQELSKRVKGFAEAQAFVAQNMSEDRKIVLLQYAESPESAARIVYYLGQHPERLEEFAKETDIGRFVRKLTKMEVVMKERKKNQPPPPEQSPRGSGAVNAGDTTLERLRKRAEQTGDYGPVNAYKRKSREQRSQRA